MATKEQQKKIDSVREGAKKARAFKIPDLPGAGILKKVGSAAKRLGSKIGRMSDRSEAFIDKHPEKVLKRLIAPAIAGEAIRRFRKKQRKREGAKTGSK